MEDVLRWPLHHAATGGSVELVLALLSTGLVVDIDRCTDDGWTAVMFASKDNHHRVVEILLQRGADVDHRSNAGFTALSIAAELGHHLVVMVLLQNGASSEANVGFAPLLLSAEHGHPVVSAALLTAGAELEVSNEHGHTPVHLAANAGHRAVVRILVEAGANADTCLSNGENPLYNAAFDGYVDVVKLLLSLGVNPARPVLQTYGETRVALDAAAEFGHRETVQELLQLGIAVCGGVRLGTDALVLAASNQHFEVMAMLRDAGAVDTQGVALFTAADNGREEVVRFLLQQKKWSVRGGTYVNGHNSFGITALCLASAGAFPRIVRMLLDAGADETTASLLLDAYTGGVCLLAPLTYTVQNLTSKMLNAKPATEDQLHRLEAIRRLLLRVEAVRAASWLWPRKTSFIAHVVGKKGKVTMEVPSLVRVWIVRRAPGVRATVLARLFRQSRKP